MQWSRTLVAAVASLTAHAQSVPTTFQHTVSYQSTAYVADFTLHTARGPNFSVQAQQANGTFTTFTPGTVRTYIGTIAALPGAMASAVRRANGTVLYHVLFEDGAEWIYTGGSTTLRTDSTWTPNYPTSVVGAGGSGSSVWAAEVGVDIPYSQYSVDNNVDAALEMVEHSVNTVNLLYLRDAGITHRLGRIVVRAAAAQDPYLGMTTTNDLLTTVSNQWNNVLPASTHDLGLIATSATGGGLAYVGVVGNPGYSANGATGTGDFTVVWRHEVGHNWSLSHYDGGTPEGATINSGNSLSRMSGPEQAKAIAHRNARAGYLNNLGAYPVAIPPHASLDRTSYLPYGYSSTIDVLNNDHDANGEAFTIAAFDSTSRLGGTIARSVGTGPGGRDQLLYTPPANQTLQVDRFTYRIADTAGREGLGNVVAQLTFDTDLLARFAMDEGGGTLTRDSSSYNRNAELLGGAAWSTGRHGYGIALDGVDDVVEAPAPDKSTANFTVTGWIKRSGTQADWAGIAFCRGGTTAMGLGFGSANGLRYLWNGGMSSWSSGLTVPDNTWTFVALVVTATSGTIYMNSGAGLQSATNYAAHAAEAFDAALTFGWDPSSSARYFSGAMDEFQVHARALSSAEILAAANGLTTVANPSPTQLATVFGPSVGLSWTTSPTTTNHRIYLSQSYAAVRNGLATALWSYTTGSSFTTPLLSSGTWFWRVDASNGSVWAPGPLWGFTVTSSANVTLYGTGCRGSNNQIPSIGALGVPRVGNATFGMQVTQAAPQSVAALLFAYQPAVVPFGSCLLLLGGTIAGFPQVITDATGSAMQAIPIPNVPSLIGLRIYGQFLVLDPGGALYGAGSMSNGLIATIML